MNENEVRTFRKQLFRWFDENQRDLPWRHTGDPYHVWISEVMLQQTQVATVVPYFNRFIARYPDVFTLASAGLQDILKNWEGMGYYARARNLHKAAKVIRDEHDGRLPDSYEQLRELPGIGDYIACAVASIAFNNVHAALDGNVKRVLARLFAIETPANKTPTPREFRDAAASLIDPDRPGDFNQAMMELGATVCRPSSPRCDVCSVSTACVAFGLGRQHELPLRTRRKPVPLYHIVVGIVHKDDRVLITRRKESGLLGGLWEFPGGKVQEGEDTARACQREIHEEVSLNVEVMDYLTHVDHAYSHFKIGVDVYSCRYQAGDVKLHGPVDFRWVLVDELDDYPFPAANHKFLPLVKQALKQR
jgi:A/G-specific adenine glycosylase